MYIYLNYFAGDEFFEGNLNTLLVNKQNVYLDPCVGFLSLRLEVFDVVDSVESVRANVMASCTP